ncbi:CAP-Gly domain-containing linker protein 3-like isoform X2 [Panonychus citri]|nr:CAP-Gly domain-containing linker protein 3-like isoform X2 [Panonychus citri]XP_053208560.1 CAP-Gly domain-containing linker protein 3-like isoform X2 [Panonychus citri]XP_053208561.1 CAP-Gly domain-containing linker protein 3-like isoform X2 [Panonychus citri]
MATTNGDTNVIKSGHWSSPTLNSSSSISSTEYLSSNGHSGSDNTNGNGFPFNGSLTIEPQNGYEIMTFEPKWTSSKIHIASDPPFCKTCEQLDTTFFNIQCHNCREILTNPETTISQLFAILRQWVPQIQYCIELLVKEILKRGAHHNDKDGLTDMTLLHYACKAGSSGVGDVRAALRTVHLLISKGADIGIRCRWTDMAAIHYAVYFDVSEIVDYLLTISDRTCIDDVCHDFEGGTPLHIAAANLCIDSVKVLLKHGANVLLKDDHGRTALDCVPDPTTLLNSSILAKQGAVEVAIELRALLEKAFLATIPGETFTFEGPVTGKVVLQALGLQLGDKVVINGVKSGILRFCGATQFAPGIWAGVELEEPEGKHDGNFQGVTYFRCPPNHGIFAPISKICKYDNLWRNVKGTSQTIRIVNHPGVDVSHVTPKVETGLNSLKYRTANVAEVGDRVILTDKRIGVVRFVGETSFASGIWYGIELSKAIGKNDGSVEGVKYFDCKPLHGLFVPPGRILRVTKNMNHSLSSNNNNNNHYQSTPNDKTIADDESSECSLTLSRSSSERAKSPLSMRRLRSRSSLKSSSFSPTSYPHSSIYNHNNSSSSLSSPINNYNNNPNSLLLSAPPSSWLTLGVNVFVNNEVGVVRYIGPVDFAQGTWLGLELRSANGKNDGSVQGKRYFTCKPGHGLLVRPKKVSVRGINGAKLLPDD